MRVLGIDLGEKRVGVAVSDEDATIASPLGVIQRVGDRTLLADLKRLVREQGVGLAVVGLPLHMDGREGPEAERARRLAGRLAEKTGVPVELWDERLSTVAAERSLREAGVPSERSSLGWGGRSRASVDAVAAALILQSYLDSRRSGPTAWPADEA